MVEGRISGGPDRTGVRVGTRVALHARIPERVPRERGVANPLGEGESEFAALNMVDSRIGCAVAGRYGPHHRPARRTIPVRCIPTIQRRVHPLSLRRERKRERERNRK